MHGSRSLRALCVLSLAWRAAADDTRIAAEDGYVTALEDALTFDDDAANKHVVAFVELYASHNHNTLALFAHYNKWTGVLEKDGRDGEQALGKQEVRALLKDIGLGNVLLRGELAALAIRLVDSSGDGKVQLAELAAALDVATCWLDVYGGADEALVLAPAHRLAHKASAALANERGAVAELVESELHGCAPLEQWWKSGWQAALAAHEERALGAGPITGGAPACEAALSGALAASAAKHGGKKDGLAGATAIRAALKAKGLEPLLVRHLAARVALDELDADGDRKLSAEEVEPAFAAACAAYAGLRGRGGGLAAAARALSLPAAAGGYTPSAFLRHLGTDGTPPYAGAPLGAETLSLARAAAAGREKGSGGALAAAAAIVQAYASLAPSHALGGGARGAHEEL